MPLTKSKEKHLVNDLRYQLKYYNSLILTYSSGYFIDGHVYNHRDVMKYDMYTHYDMLLQASRWTGCTQHMPERLDCCVMIVTKNSGPVIIRIKVILTSFKGINKK